MYLYLVMNVNRRVRQGELPKGQERVPWGIPASRNSLTRYTARHLRIMYLAQFIFVGAVYYNVLTTCATLLCRACLDEITYVAVMYL